VSTFYDYVRGLSDIVPEGYTAQGMAVYRHHVYLGISQMLAASYPELKTILDDSDWRTLMEDYIRQHKFSSHFYADLTADFEAYLRAQSSLQHQSL